MYPAEFTYHAPESLDEALNLMAEHGDEAKLLAGGHSLLPTMKLRLATPAHLIDMKKLSDLQKIETDGDTLQIGALCTYHAIMDSEAVKAHAPLLVQCLHEVGDQQVRNRGTLGGSLAHADPAGDPPAPILALGAELVVRGAEGERTVPAHEFFHGFFETAVGEGEILTFIRIPKQRGKSAYEKFRHPASHYAVCGVAVLLETDGDTVSSCRVAITGVGGAAYRARAVEEALEGQTLSEDVIKAASERACDDLDMALEDPFADAEYREALAKAYAKRALMIAWKA